MLIQSLRIVLVFIVLVFLVGCQQGKDSVEQQEGPVPLSLQLQWVVQAQFAGYFVALEKGFYLDEGIDLTIHSGGPDNIPVDLVAARSRDFGTALLPDLTVEIQKKKPVISIGQILQNNGLLLLARKSDGITGPADFVGKKVGVWLGSWESQFDALLASVGVDLRDVQIVSQGWSMAPFIDGTLDVASAMVYNEYHKVLAAGIKKDELQIINYSDYGLDFPGDVLFTSVEMVEEKPELCRKMLKASLQGWRYAVAHPEEAVEIVLKYDSSKMQTYDHQITMLKEIESMLEIDKGGLGVPNQKAIQTMVHYLVSYGILEEPLLMEDIYTTEFLE